MGTPTRAASGLAAIIAVSLLPAFWTYSSLAAVAVTVAWACLSASRAKPRLPAPTDRRPLAGVGGDCRVVRYLPTPLTFTLIAGKLGISRSATRERAERV